MWGLRSGDDGRLWQEAYLASIPNLPCCTRE
jgi:hypothetical protein